MEKRRKIVFTILILASFLRLISINQSLWMDEAISATVVKHFSFTGIFSKFILSDTHPPLYYLILKLFTDFFGYSELALRAPSVIFGVLTVFVAFKIGEIFRRKIGFYAFLLTATSPLLIYYSQEARMYSLSAFLVTLSVYFFFKKKWGYLSAALLFTGMNDYLPLLILAPLWGYMLLSVKDKKDRVGFALSHLPLTAFIFVWFPVLERQSFSTTEYLKSFPAWKDVLGSATIKNLSLVWVKFIIGRISFDNKILYGIVVLLASIPYLYPLIKQRINNKNAFLWGWFIIPIIISFIGSFFLPGFSYFRFIFCLPALYLIVSLGLAELKFGRNLFVILVLMHLLFSSIYLFNKSFWREDWKGAVSFLEGRLKYNEVVLVSYPEPFTPYLWYSQNPNGISTFSREPLSLKEAVYTLDYLMDLTDPGRTNYNTLKNLGFSNTEIYNFRGVGQIRYWTR